MDVVLWAGAIVLVAASFSCSHFFSGKTLLGQWLLGGFCGVLALFLVIKTSFGQAVQGLWREACQEMRRVYWPSRTETTQMTIAVLGMVFVMALLLWTVDSGLLWLVKWLTCQWGVR